MTYDCSEGLEICGNSGRFDARRTRPTLWIRAKRIPIHHCWFGWTVSNSHWNFHWIFSGKFSPENCWNFQVGSSNELEAKKFYGVRQSRILWFQNLQMEGHQLAFKNQHTEKSKNLKRSIKDAFTFCHSNDVNVNEPEAERITSKGVNRVNRLPAFEFKFLKSAKFFIISSAFEGLNDSTIIQSASRVSRKL